MGSCALDACVCGGGGGGLKRLGGLGVGGVGGGGGGGGGCKRVWAVCLLKVEVIGLASMYRIRFCL